MIITYNSQFITAILNSFSSVIQLGNPSKRNNQQGVNYDPSIYHFQIRNKHSMPFKTRLTLLQNTQF